MNHFMITRGEERNKIYLCNGNVSSDTLYTKKGVYIDYEIC